MKTPINSIETTLEWQQRTDELFERFCPGNTRNYPPLLAAAIAEIETNWTNAIGRLSVHGWDYFSRTSLELTYDWVRSACMYIFYSEIMLRVPATAAEEQQMRSQKDRDLCREVRRLIRLVRRIVHELQREHEKTATTEMTAMYAEAICGRMRYCLGATEDPSDLRYKHSERVSMIRLHARTKRRLANLFVRWAALDDSYAEQISCGHCKARRELPRIDSIFRQMADQDDKVADAIRP